MDKKEFKSGQESPLQKLFNYYTQPISLDKDERLSGLIGWVSLFAFVVAYDAYAIKSGKIETLTRFFWRNTESKAAKYAPIFAWLILTGHLLLEKDVRKKKFGIQKN